jgi:acetylornithine/succinyldiaminopimelate/putrescine aminotransferase
VRINPPLVIGEEQAMEALATMREVLRDTAQRISA